MSEHEVELTSEERRTPAYWCTILDARIMDHDGWRGDDAPDWNEPITRDEFERRFAMCTVDSRGYPDFVGHPLAARLADTEARAEAAEAKVARVEALADELAHPDTDLIVAYERAVHRNIARDIREALRGVE